ncbi:T6SS immunity protein Tli4 family protein [Zoogloea sp.]|uniref:T6SS immunity protein Tli4 family protein n=1 Tax=Zoogloea sp. TaxID=49181 RepID=UPI0035B47695
MLAMAALAVAAIGGFGWKIHREHQMSQDLFDKPMHTLCVGRHLIDVPAQYVLEYHRYRIDGVDIESLGEMQDEAAFKAKLSKREAELSQEKNEYGKPSMERTEDLSLDSSSGKLFLYGRKKPVYWFEDGKKIVTEDELTGEGWLWLGNHGVSFKGSYRRTDVREILMQRATPLRSLSADEIPAEPGYCMEMDLGRAFIAGAPPPEQHEATEIQFGLKHHPDVKFRLVISTNGDKLDEPLLARAARAEQTLAHIQHRFNKLRSGPRPVNGMEGQELVEAVHEADGARVHALDWEALGKPTDPTAPSINFEGKTGYKGYKHTNSSLSDAQVLKLWDRIVNSIRLRTTSPARHSEAPPPRTPLGALALTGRACPETGWWQCADEGAPVLGGSRQFIRQNEPMPEVVLQGEPSLWQRVKGETPQFRRATVWQLSAYPDDAAATHATAPDTARSNAPQPPADKS